MSATALVEKLTWDTEFFGFGVGKVTADTLTDGDLPLIDDFCRRENIHVVFFLTDAENVECVHVAEEGGFRFIDDRITLERNIGPSIEREPSPDIEVRTQADSDVPALKEIAREIFTYDRFHSDPNFQQEKCDEMRAVWTENLCGDLGDHVKVAEIGGEIAGYIALKVADGAGEIVLTGVAPFAQGNGVGTTLTKEAIIWFKEQNLSSAKVATQSRNIPAQRLYQELSFRTISSEFWLHKWYNP